MNNNAVACLDKYGDFKSFCNVFGITKVESYIQADADKMYMGTAPSLTTMRASYGDKETNLWLCLYLADIAKFKGLNDVTTPEILNDVANSIRSVYGYLKATEFMVFFSMFKTSQFRNDRGEDATKMYGKFQGDVIMDCLSIFSKHRASEITRIENALNTERIKNNKGITYAEWLKMQSE